MKLHGGINTWFSVGGWVSRVKKHWHCPTSCLFLTFCPPLCLSRIAEESRVLWKISSFILHPRKHVLSPLQELQVIRIYQYPWEAILWNAQLQSLCKSVTQQINSNPKVASNMEKDCPEWIATHLCKRQQSWLITLQ
jgi:hypothetical protein